MIEETINRLKGKISSAETINDETKNEINSIIDKLSTEITNIKSNHPEPAQSIVDFANLSTTETIKEKQNPDLKKLSIDGLTLSIKEFEVSHPSLTETVNNLCQKLANIGI